MLHLTNSGSELDIKVVCVSTTERILQHTKKANEGFDEQHIPLNIIKRPEPPTSISSPSSQISPGRVKFRRVASLASFGHGS